MLLCGRVHGGMTVEGAAEGAAIRRFGMLSVLNYCEAHISLDRGWCNRVKLHVLRYIISIGRYRFEDREEESHVCNSSDRRKAVSGRGR